MIKMKLVENFSHCLSMQHGGSFWGNADRWHVTQQMSIQEEDSAKPVKNDSSVIQHPLFMDSWWWFLYWIHEEIQQIK